VSKREAKQRLGEVMSALEIVLTGALEGDFELQSKVRACARVGWCSLELATAIIEATEVGGNVDLVELRKRRFEEALGQFTIYGP
jgi:hypothetical protein